MLSIHCKTSVGNVPSDWNQSQTSKFQKLAQRKTEVAVWARSQLGTRFLIPRTYLWTSSYLAWLKIWSPKSKRIQFEKCSYFCFFFVIAPPVAAFLVGDEWTSSSTSFNSRQSNIASSSGTRDRKSWQVNFYEQLTKTVQIS